MNTKLNHIQNWPELARQANWSASTLAKLCGVSKDTLRRHILEKQGKPTKIWLAAVRQEKAIGLLCGGSSVKETSAALGYRQQTNFTRQFKAFWGICPTTPQNPESTSKMRPND